MKSTLIVGCGISGLTLARKLQESQGNDSILIVDKSRGVGGRLATRRTEGATFDHGAQFYRTPPGTEYWHLKWQESGVVTPLATPDSFPRFCGVKGMTSLAKALSQGLRMELNKKIVHLFRKGNLWQAKTDTHDVFTTQQVILTCPLPQSLDILDASEIHYAPDLRDIRYSKALVVLLEGVTSSNSELMPNASAELNKFQIATIFDQHKKGTSPTPAWTVYMDKDFSEKNFERSDEEILLEAHARLKEWNPGLSFSKSYLKKWRYSEPQQTYTQLFANPSEDLYLIGDAFGGPSIANSIKSAEALWSSLARN